MTYLAQMLGTTLMGVVHGHTAPELARMDHALRMSAAQKAAKYGKLRG